MAETPKKTPAKKSTPAKKTASTTKAAPAVKAAAAKTPAKKTAAVKTAAVKTSAVKTAAPVRTPGPAPTHYEISMLAYTYWTERGHHHGSDAQDWLRAEQELNKA